MTWYKKAEKVKRCVWNKRLRLWWYKLWIRKDEFHDSLDIDPEAMIEMDEQKGKEYFSDLIERRKIAHQRDLAGFKGSNLFSLLNLYNNRGDVGELEITLELKKDIIQAIRRKGLNISVAHFDAIMKFWGIEEIEAMLKTER